MIAEPIAKATNRRAHRRASKQRRKRSRVLFCDIPKAQVETSKVHRRGTCDARTKGLEGFKKRSNRRVVNRTGRGLPDAWHRKVGWRVYFNVERRNQNECRQTVTQLLGYENRVGQIQALLRWIKPTNLGNSERPDSDSCCR